MKQINSFVIITLLLIPFFSSAKIKQTFKTKSGVTYYQSAEKPDHVISFERIRLNDHPFSESVDADELSRSLESMRKVFAEKVGIQDYRFENFKIITDKISRKTQLSIHGSYIENKIFHRFTEKQIVIGGDVQIPVIGTQRPAT